MVDLLVPRINANESEVLLVEVNKKNNDRCDKDELICRFGKLDYSIAERTVRQSSLGRGELVQLYVDSYPDSLNPLGNLEEFFKC